MSDHRIVDETVARAASYQVVPATGPGVLARVHDLVLLCGLPAGQAPLVASLLDTVAAVAEVGAGGTELTNQLAGLIAKADPAAAPSFCAFGPADDGIAFVVHGRAELVFGVGEAERRFGGDDGVTLVDRIHGVSTGSVRAVIDGAELELDLPTAPESSHANGKPEPLADAEAVEESAAAVAQVTRIDEAREQSEPRPAEGGSGAAGALVLGVYCRRSHFNDPAMVYCTVCGISMAQSTRTKVLDRRPSLGVLVLDDGRMFSLVRDHVVGRAPGMEQAVAAGLAEPVELADPSVSRVHARIELHGWDVRVVDNDSTYGTYVCPPGSSEWSRVPVGTGAALHPGTMLAFGRRVLRYHSHRAQSVDYSVPLHAAA